MAGIMDGFWRWWSWRDKERLCEGSLEVLLSLANALAWVGVGGGV